MNPPFAGHRIEFSRTRFSMPLGGLIGALLASAALAASPVGGKAKVPVTLFGQPCFLQGPFEQKMLQLVHGVSPEQLVSPFGSGRTADQTRRAIEKLEKTTGLPTTLDRYHDKLARQLKAQLTFLDGIEAAKKANRSEPLIVAVKTYVRAGRLKDLEALAAKLPRGPAASLPQSQVIDQLFELYSDSTDNDAEEEFHRAIRRMNIQYACNYDDEDSAAGADEAESEDSAVPAAKGTAPAKKRR